MDGIHRLYQGFQPTRHRTNLNCHEKLVLGYVGSKIFRSAIQRRNLAKNLPRQSLRIPWPHYLDCRFFFKGESRNQIDHFNFTRAGCAASVYIHQLAFDSQILSVVEFDIFSFRNCGVDRTYPGRHFRQEDRRIHPHIDFCLLPCR